MKVLLTGLTGFLGSNVADRLLQDGYKVSAIVRDEVKISRFFGERFNMVKVLKGDLLVKEDVTCLGKELSNDGSFDIVVHTIGGGPLTSNAQFTQKIHDLNYGTTVNLVQILKESGNLRDVKLFLYLSSLAAMGIGKDSSARRVVFTESSECSPMLPYERVKFDTEEYLKELSKGENGIRVAVLRPSQVYGGSGEQFPQMVKLIRRGIFPVVRGRVGSLPLVHVSDVINAMSIIIKNHDVLRDNFNVFLVCEGSYNYDGFAEMVKMAYGSGSNLHVPYFLMFSMVSLVEGFYKFAGKAEPLNRYRLESMTKERLVDTSKLTNNFGFTFKYNIKSYLEDLARQELK